MSIVPVPVTPEMQALWNRAMLIARTRGAYGCAFPQPGTTFPLPQQGTMLMDILYAVTAPPEEYDAFLQALRDDMLVWKARVAASPAKRRESIVRDTPVDPKILAGLDMSKVEFKL